MTAKLSKDFHGVGIGPLSKILAVNGIVALDTHFYIFNISQIHKESITCVQKYPALHWAFLQIRKENHQTSCISITIFLLQLMEFEKAVKQHGL